MAGLDEGELERYRSDPIITLRAFSLLYPQAQSTVTCIPSVDLLDVGLHTTETARSSTRTAATGTSMHRHTSGNHDGASHNSPPMTPPSTPTTVLRSLRPYQPWPCLAECLNSSRRVMLHVRSAFRRFLSTHA